MKLILILLMFVTMAVVYRIVGTKAETAVREKLRTDRLEPITVKAVWWKGSRYTTYTDFVARSSSGELVKGYALKRGREIDVVYDAGFDRHAHLREALSATGLVVDSDGDQLPDLETRIGFETNQRLERLQGDREAFLANDTNNDGVVDAAEWADVRARVEAEVRAELTGAADQGSTPTPEPAVSEPSEHAPEPEPVTEVASDGHW